MEYPATYIIGTGGGFHKAKPCQSLFDLKEVWQS